MTSPSANLNVPRFSARVAMPTFRLPPPLLLTAVLAGCGSIPEAPPSIASAPAPVVSTLPAPPLAPAPAGALAEIVYVADQALARTPTPRSAITTQGLMFTDQAYVESKEAKRDWLRMLALALAARHTGQSRYALAFNDYLDAWLAVYQPSNDPISETDFFYVVLAADLLRDQLGPERQRQAGRLFRRMANGYLDAGRYPPGTARSNWQSHRIKLASLMAFVLRDEDLLRRCRQAFRQQIEHNLRPDGRVADFESRDALHYVTYSLEPLLIAALMAREHGQDWFAYESPSGSSLSRSLHWLADYAAGRKTHEEFRRTVVEFDRRRAAAGLPGFSGLWNPTNAARCYQLAARLDPQWSQLADRLGPPQAWLELRFPAANP